MSSNTRIAVAIVAVLVLGGALYLLLPKSEVESSVMAPSPSSTPTSAPVATTQPIAGPSTAASSAAPAVFDTRTIADDFALPMKATLPVGWRVGHDIVGTLGFLNVGGPESSWWGPDILLVEDAQIHDPSDVVSSEPATASRDNFVPWPADLMEYITGLPDVTVVSGPEPITIGGITGTEITVMTPPMHPLVWMDGDFTWLGGGRTGVDGAAERRFIVLETGGHTLLITLANDPSTFDARNAELQTILDSITFE